MSQTPQLRSKRRSDQAPDSDAAGASGTRTEDSIRAEPDQEQFQRRHLLCLLGFTLVAAVLRLWNLGTWSYWVDEAHTVRDVVGDEASFWAGKTSRYPMSYLVLRWLQDLCGLADAELTERFMRLPFAFFGIASVPALAVVGRGMIGRKAALLAALFLALSPWHIYWSQNARSYSMVLFFTLLATGATYYGFQNRSRLQLLVGLLLYFFAGFCHPSAYTVVAAALAYLVIVMFTSGGPQSFLRGKWAPLMIVAAVVVIAWLLLPILQTALNVKAPVFSLPHLIKTLAYSVGIPVLVAAGGGLLVLFDRGERAALFLACMVILPLIGLGVLASGVMQTVNAQYAIAILPAIHMLAAVLVISISSVFPRKGLRSLVLRLAPLAMVVIDMAGQDFLYFEKEYGRRPRWREAVSYIKAQRQGDSRDLHILTTNRPSMAVYFDPDKNMAKTDHERGPIFIESLEKYIWKSRNAKKPPREPQPEVFLRETIENAKANNKDLWVVFTAPELHAKDYKNRADAYFRNYFKHMRTLPNWTGPKDMIVEVYHLR